MIEKAVHYVPNRDGWELALRRRVDPERLDKRRRPVAIVPGYGMNSHIFGYHPKGLSLEEYVASRGFEVWSIDMRRQGLSRPLDGGGRCRKTKFGLKELATVDLAEALDYISENTSTDGRGGKVDCIGCSLAGSIVSIYIVLNSGHKIDSFIALGAPLRWVEVPLFVRVAFGSPAIIGSIPFVKSRELAGFFLPKLIKVPHLLDIYIHGSHTDMTHVEEVVKTVEDPVPRINREIAVWVKQRDLIVDGVNICEGMRRFTGPLLCVVANADGIVPPRTALSLLDLAGSKVKDHFTVGTDEFPFAHADLYVSDHAGEMHFRPVADWMEKQYFTPSS
jgi:pimeloyl-ACP methyl ester carboxylesterase